MHETLAWRADAVECIPAGERDEIRELWRSDPHASPFAGPAFLDFLVRAARRGGERALLARGRDDAGRLAALWPLRLDRRGRLALLQGLQGDHGTCLARGDVPVAALGDGLAQVLARDDVRSAALLRVPPWGPTLAAARVAVDARGIGHRVFAATPCPVLAVAPGPDVGARMADTIEGHRRVRNYENRLRKQPGFAFEALEDASDLAAWAREFADLHELRWDATPTPSEFRNRARRAHLVDTLTAAQADGALVRFALRLGDQRLGLVAALRGPDRLVYHLVVTSPDADPWRAGHVLIRAIGLWMAERGLGVLDFGEGAEPYKLRYANADERLWRVVAWRSALSRTALAGWIDEQARRSPAREQAWDTWVNRRLRGDVASAVREARIRIPTLARSLVAGGPSIALARVAARLRARREILFRALGGSGIDASEVVRIAPDVALELMEREAGLLPAHRPGYLAAARRGAAAFGVLRGDRAVHVSWLLRWNGVELPDSIRLGSDAPWSVLSGVTARTERRRGLFRRTLATIRARLPADAPVFVYTEAWNVPSRRAIERAGFEPVAEIVTPRGGRPVLQPLS